MSILSEDPTEQGTETDIVIDVKYLYNLKSIAII